MSKRTDREHYVETNDEIINTIAPTRNSDNKNSDRMRAASAEDFFGWLNLD
jgi:hypothetical protein